MTDLILWYMQLYTDCILSEYQRNYNIKQILSKNPLPSCTSLESSKTHKKYKWQGTQAYVLIFTTLQKKFISRKHCKILHKYGSFMALKNMTDKQMELAYPGLQRNAYSPTTKLLHVRHKL